jgi:hypothetical protein
MAFVGTERRCYSGKVLGSDGQNSSAVQNLQLSDHVHKHDCVALGAVTVMVLHSLLELQNHWGG